MQLTIVDTGAGFVTNADGAGVASIRERLAAFYGETGDLALHPSPSGGTEAVLRIPYERAATV